MSAEEYTPTTEEVRSDYENGRWNDGVGPSGTGPEFDRWLAAHDRKTTIETVKWLRDEFAAAALRGIGPTLNHAVARLLHLRAVALEHGVVTIAPVVIREVES